MMAKKNTKNILPTETTPSAIVQQLPTSLEVSTAEMSVIKTACVKAGISIDDYVLAIKDALKATKTTVDKFGDEHVDEDHAMRLKAALMGLELEGYIKAKGTVTDQSKHTHVTYSWQPVQVVNTVSDGGRLSVD